MRLFALVLWGPEEQRGSRTAQLFINKPHSTSDLLSVSQQPSSCGAWELKKYQSKEPPGSGEVCSSDKHLIRLICIASRCGDAGQQRSTVQTL